MSRKELSFHPLIKQPENPPEPGKNVDAANISHIKALMEKPNLDAATRQAELNKIPITKINDEILDAIILDDEGKLRANAFETVSEMVKSEITNGTGNTVFRENNIASKLLTHFLKHEGGNWARKILDGMHTHLTNETEKEAVRIEEDIMKPLKSKMKKKIKGKKIKEEKLRSNLENVPEKVKDELLTPYSYPIKKENFNLDSFISPLPKLLIQDSMKTITLEAAREILVRFDESLGLDSANPIPNNVIKIMQVLSNAGKQRVSNPPEGAKELTSQQKTAFEGIVLQQCACDALTPALWPHRSGV